VHFRCVIQRLIIGIAGAVMVASCSGPSSDTFGRELYEQSCVSCHGSDGGGTPGRPAIGPGSDAVQLTDQQLRGVMEVGPGAMPSFSRLSPEQLESLVEYVRQLQAGGDAGE